VPEVLGQVAVVAEVLASQLVAHPEQLIPAEAEAVVGAPLVGQVAMVELV